MQYIKDLVSNYVLASAFFAWLVAQIIKVVTAMFEKPRQSIVAKFTMSEL